MADKKTKSIISAILVSILFISSFLNINEVPVNGDTKFLESFNAYDEFSFVESDGDIWKYKLDRNGNMSVFTQKDNIAWREGNGSYVGVGTNPSAVYAGLIKPVELNSYGNSLGVLQFNVPVSGLYRIPAFKFSRIDGWAESGMVLYIRINGEIVFESDKLNATSLYIEDNTFELSEGDTIDFYSNYKPIGNSFSNCFVENLIINLIDSDQNSKEDPGIKERIELTNPHKISETFIIENNNVKSFNINETSLHFNKMTGDLIAIDNKGIRLNMEAGIIDTGLGNYDGTGNYIRNTMAYFDFDYLATYEIPNINYNLLADYNYENAQFVQGSDEVRVSSVYGSLTLETIYKVTMHGTEIYVKAKNTSDETLMLNGMAFVLKNIVFDQNTSFSFPGNLPHSNFIINDIPDGATYSTKYSGPLTHVKSGNKGFNFIFVNEDEKWSTGVVKGLSSLPQRLHIVNLTALQSYLNPGEELSCGRLYIQIAGEDDPYKKVVDLYNSKGWKSPDNGIKDGGIYSGHPAGTSDGFFAGGGREFSDRPDKTLAGFADELPKIKELGFDNLWILPIFEHPDNSGSVYMPYNMEKIDSRYGGNEAAVNFGKAAKSAGLNLMIDYVPHGPPPNIGGLKNMWVDDITSEWISIDRFGDYRMEWSCFAYDYAHPDYLEYIKNLVITQANNFGFTGTRIDCAMGSLPNWNAAEGNRPSNTNTKGGYLMTKAIREGFLESGVTPAVMPENFHPIPFYAPVTDFFYDIPFYNLTLELRKSDTSEQKFATEVAAWLDLQYKTKPQGQIFARFLGNHDTVANWYSNYDNERPKDVYGKDKAHALWVLLATIDGIPMIYQGDETGSEEFFKELMEMRKEYLGTSYETEYYLEDDNGIIMFRRFKEENQKLILVNLQNKKEDRNMEEIIIGDSRFNKSEYKIIYGNGEIKNDSISLSKYGYVVLEKAPESSVDFLDDELENKSESRNKIMQIFIIAPVILLIAAGLLFIFYSKKRRNNNKKMKRIV